MTMRTGEEIVARIQADKSLGFGSEVLVPYLTFEQARPLLKPEATAADWPEPKGQAPEGIRADMAEYMAFAWGKAEDHRGISAYRSVEKMCAWLWLLGDEELLTFANTDGNYRMYGCPILAAISRKHDLPIPEDEAVQRMIQGQPCGPECSGCRS